MFSPHNGTAKHVGRDQLATDIQGDAEITRLICVALNLLELASDRLRLLFDLSQGETKRGCHRMCKEWAAGLTIRFRFQAGHDISFLFESPRLNMEPVSVVFNGYRVLSWGKEAGA